MGKLIPADYATLLSDIKQRIRSAQYEALKAVKLWLDTDFENNERHARRIKQIKDMEKNLLK